MIFTRPHEGSNTALKSDKMPELYWLSPNVRTLFGWMPSNRSEVSICLQFNVLPGAQAMSPAAATITWFVPGVLVIVGVEVTILGVFVIVGVEVTILGVFVIVGVEVTILGVFVIVGVEVTILGVFVIVEVEVT